MAVAAVPAAYIAREVGEAFGPAPIQQTALTLADGESISGAIAVGAHGVLFSWAVGVLVTYLSLVAGLERPSNTDEEDDTSVDTSADASADASADDAPTEEVETWTTDTPSENGASVGAAGLTGDVGAGQRRQMGEHDPLAAEKGEFGA
jgi:hypothetical protein